MRKFKVSIIGYGYWGPKLARNFQNSNFFNLTSIIDVSKKNLIKAKRDFPLANVGSDYKQSLNKLNISLIVISTPTKTHFQIAKYALEKKINVLVEKPLSLSIKEVKILESLAKKNKVLLFVDYPFLFSGSVKFIRKLIDNKKFGNLIEREIGFSTSTFIFFSSAYFAILKWVLVGVDITINETFNLFKDCL